MSYQVLARKWRPQSFETMVGQSHVLKALSNALEQGRLHHAYLLTGTRGVGKTTIARILARCLNCDEGVSATPCGVCPTCKEITEGRSVDLIEVDAASRTKVEDTRELLDNVQYAPSQCRYKIYLIDEVHMLSNHSFNALLKTLEEPPPHAVFLFATTHPQKLPPTVLSRCLQFHLKNLTPQLIVNHLTTVFDAENVSYDEDGLWIIARAASGSMRDALSLADQAIAFGGGSVMGDAVNEMLGTVDHDVLTQLLAAIVAGNADKALAVVSAYAERAPDFVGLVDELLKLIHRIAVEQAVPGAGSEGQLYRTFIHDYAGLISPEDLQLFYQSLLVGKRDLALAPDPITGIEMIVLRLFAFRIAPADVQLEQGSHQSTSQASPQSAAQSDEVPPAKKLLAEAAAEQTAAADAFSVNNQVAPSTELLEPVIGGLAETAVASTAAVTVETPVVTAAVTAESQDLTRPVQSPAASMRDNFDATPAYSAPPEVELAKIDNADVAIAREPVNVHESVTHGMNQDSGEGGNPALDTLTPLSWCEIFAALPLSGVVRTVASYCVPIENSDEGATGQVVFALADDNATLFNDEHPARLAKGLSIYYGKPLTIKINIVEDWSSLGLPDNVETPADYRVRVKVEIQGEALASIQGDDNVKSIIDAFDGELDTDTVRSL
ncbi:MAG: DNA polymerase III subunit gamma/tau [Cellvibrionales bacterium]|nr:DNA polymerase III subunit gamma/tau [Cellvibrionales bacterium]